MTELAGVSRTAVGVAAARAGESARVDRLFDDPYASRFVEHYSGERTSFWMPGRDAASAAREYGDYFALRTRFFDDFFADAAAPQAVVLGAGLDTRAYRLDWPAGARVFELDLPPVLDFKRGVLADAEPRCTRVEVAADLAGDWPQALLDNGFAPDVRTAWLAEGLLMYLGEDLVDRVLGDAAALSTPDSELAVEHTGFSLPAKDLTSIASLDRQRLAELVAAGTRAPAALARGGWTPVQDNSVAEVAHRYGRPVPPRYAEGTDRAARARLVRSLRSPGERRRRSVAAPAPAGADPTAAPAPGTPRPGR